MTDMELIDRKALGIGKCNPDVFPAENLPYAKGWNGAIGLLEQAPTIDAVPVVRCKDCKYQEDCIGRIQFWGRNPVLELNTTEYHPLVFCSYGERKDDGICKED